MISYHVLCDNIITLCREKETDILKEQIDKLNIAIMKEEEKAQDLETKAQYVISTLFVCSGYSQCNQH